LDELNDFFGVRSDLGDTVWKTGSAIRGDAKIVSVIHGHLEEAILSPVGTPGVSSDPVALTIGILAPSNNGDLVVDLWEPVMLRENTSGIVLELISGINTAGDWSMGHDLLLHLVSSIETIVILHEIVVVLDSPAFVLAGLSNWAWWPGAVLASSLRVAASINSNVLLAR